jgi:hypothetical protein
MNRSWTPIVIAAVLLAGNQAAAQVEIKAKAAEIKLTGRVHAMWDYSSADDDLSNFFLIRRARVTVRVKVNDLVSGKIQPEYSTGFGLTDGLKLRDAYIDLTFDPALVVRMGQFKRPFDLFELVSSTQIPVIERTGAVRGADDCAGVGRLCTYSRLTEKLQYADRDVGLGLSGVLADGRVAYRASVTNGTRFESGVVSALADTIELIPDGKSFTGRLEYRAAGLKLAANVAAHDFANPVTRDDIDYGLAYGADLEWGGYGSGLHVQAGVTAGDNWRNLDAAGRASTFWATQGIVTYRFTVPEGRVIEAIEPVARVSFADPDTDAADDAGLLMTPGLVVHFTGRNKVALNVDIYKPGDGREAEYSVKVMSYLHF